MAWVPDLRRYSTLVEAVDDIASRHGEVPIMVAERADADETWTRAEIVRRSRYAAWRLKALGLERGAPVMVRAASGPELATFYLAAWRAALVPVPLDLRLTGETVAKIAERAESGWLASDDSPLPAVGAERLAHLKPISLAELVADSTADLPSDLQQQMAGWQPAGPEDLLVVLFTSGTTGQPRGVMISHRNFLEPLSIAFARRSVRILMRLTMSSRPVYVSVMPLTHYFGLLAMIGAFILDSTLVYPAGRSPRALLESMRRHRPTTVSSAPRFLELYWKQLVREVDARGELESFERRRALARRLPYWVRRRMFRRELALIGGRVRSIGSSAAYLAPDLQQAWESIGLPVYQGYGATETGGVAGTSIFRHRPGTVGRPGDITRLELAEDGEILVSGPSVSAGYWRDPEATRAAWDAQGRYHTGDVGAFDAKGDLVLIGRKKNVIVLADGLNVYPEDIEAKLHAAGLGETVVLETAPGRIEAVILDPERELAEIEGAARMNTAEREEALRSRIDAAIAAANAQLTIHERVDGWRLWPAADFPRTHTFKIQRDPVREWAANGSVPLQVREGLAEA